MLKPLKQWICDSCGKLIESPEDGYVIWEQDSEFHNRGYRIIHKKRECNNERFPLSSSLSSFLGLDGLNILLSHLSLGTIKKNICEESFNQIVDFDEFVDFFRRVQIPFYEEARTKFDNKNLLNYFADSNEVSPYLIDSLRYIVENF